MMMNVLWNMIIAVLCAGIAGCGPVKTGGKYRDIPAVPGDRAALIFYEPVTDGELVKKTPVDLRVYVNGVKIGTLISNGYFVYYAVPGSVSLSAGYTDDSVIAKAVNPLPQPVVDPSIVRTVFRAGKKYYIRYDFDFNLRRVALTRVPDELGEKEIRECREIIER